MSRFNAFLLFICLPCTAQLSAQEKTTPAKPSLESLAWLAGHWSGEADGRRTEEIWMAPAGGVMPGMNRSVQNGARTSFELLRIVEADGKISYLASPGGRPPTSFALKASEQNKVVFENLRNEFPQRIIYVRKGSQLTARIEGSVGGKHRSMEWTWQKAGSPAKREGTRLFRSLGTVVYRVKDLQKARAWYSDVLGARPYFDEPFYVGFRIGGQELGLDPDVKGVIKGNNQPAYWDVSNVKAAMKVLIDKGAKPDQKPQDVGGGVIVASVIDPFGNTIGIIEKPAEKPDQKE